MNSEDIRKAQLAVKNLGRASNFGKGSLEHMTCWALHEVAAQLAELNENLSSIAPDSPHGRVIRIEPVA